MSKNINLEKKREKFTKQNNAVNTKYLISGIALVLILLIIFGFYAVGKQDSSKVQLDPREEKYLGRYLPSSFKPAQLTETITYNSRIEMKDITPNISNGKISFKAGDVIKNRIVYFEYVRPSDQRVIPLMAYIKPSGKLFTGVSLCPPCQAKRQFFDSDGLLTCGSCSTKRDPETQAGISGACKLYPFDELPHKLIGDSIQIEESILANWLDQPLDRPVGEQ